MNTPTNSARDSVESTALFAFLSENGGSLFQRDDGMWQYALHVEGREGHARLTYSVGKSPEEAISGHYLFEANH